MRKLYPILAFPVMLLLSPLLVFLFLNQFTKNRRWIKLGLSLCLLATTAQATNFYIATNGVAGTSGNFYNPWPMQWGLTNSVVQPGDTVWIRGGTYTNTFTCTLSGTAGNPVYIRNYAPEESIIDGNYDGTGGVNPALIVLSSHARFMNLEVMNSYANRITVNSRAAGIDVGGNFGPANDVLIINCYVHDTGADGIGVWTSATNCGTYGNITPNIGYQNVPPDRGHGHGLYIQNSIATGFQTHRENIVPNSFDVGIQLFDQGGGDVANAQFEGNVSYNSGGPNDTTIRTVNYVMYSSSHFVTKVTADQNFGYHIPGGDTNGGFADNFQIGNFGGVENSDCILTNNYFGNGLMSVQLFTNVTFKANTNYTTDSNIKIAFTHPGAGTNTWIWNNDGWISPKTQPFDFNGVPQTFATWQSVSVFFDAHSSFSASAPNHNDIFIRTNIYQPGRAHIIIYNWTNAQNVNVDFSSFLPTNTTFALKNSADFGGNNVLLTNYIGGTVSIPMTNLNVAKPLGYSASTVTNTAPLFATFVVVPQPYGSGVTNYALTCSQIDVQNAINICGPGDTVVVPNGVCDITAVITMPSIPIVVISANGPLNTAWRDSNNTSTQDNSLNSVFRFQTAVTNFEYRLSGISIMPGTKTNNFFDSGEISVGGQGNMVRIDNMIISNNLNCGVGWDGPFGVIDHNKFVSPNSKQPAKVKHSSFLGQGSFGDYSWSVGPMYGTSNFVFFEDNVFTNFGGVPGIGLDAIDGARYVVRHNLGIDGTIIAGHGTETTQRERSIRVAEIYSNIFDMHGQSEAGHVRGGARVITGNIFKNSSVAYSVRAYRLNTGVTPFRFADGTNAWDSNDGIIYTNGTADFGGLGTMTDNKIIWIPHQWQSYSFRDITQGKASEIIDNTANSLTFDTGVAANSPITVAGGDAYDIRKVVHILDSPGRGMGALMSNSTPVINGIAQYPNQALEPIYFWNNTLNGSSVSMNNGGFYPVILGQEIVNGTNLSWVPYVYPHPLVSPPIPVPPIPPPPGPVANVNVLMNGNVIFQGNSLINK